MFNALVNYKHLVESIATFFERCRVLVAYALINQHLGNLFSETSQNKILMVDKGAFLINKKTNLYVGVQPGGKDVVVHVMRRKQASEQAMHRFFWERLEPGLDRSSQARSRFA